MASLDAIDTPIKLRVLIVDDSRIARAAHMHAISNADFMKNERMSFVVCCGLASLNGDGDAAGMSNAKALIDTARRCCILGRDLGIAGVISAIEESKLHEVRS